MAEGAKQDKEATEKLADDDGPTDPLWKRVIYRIIPQLKRGSWHFLVECTYTI